MNKVIFLLMEENFDAFIQLKEVSYVLLILKYQLYVYLFESSLIKILFFVQKLFPNIFGKVFLSFLSLFLIQVI